MISGCKPHVFQACKSRWQRKWVDFVETFWHCECVSGLSQKVFEKKYQKWCHKHGYHFSEAKALEIYTAACGAIGVMPKTETTHLLITQAVSQLRATSTALAELKKEMLRLAESLPEYPVVQKMYGTGPTQGRSSWPRLAMHGDSIRRKPWLPLPVLMLRQTIPGRSPETTRL